MKTGNLFQTLGSQFRFRKLSATGVFFVLVVFVFNSLRGWAVINLNLSPEMVYGFSSALMISLAIWGFNRRFIIKNKKLTMLRNLFYINLLSGVYYIFSTKLLGGTVDIAVLYIYLMPYLVFLFLLVPINRLHMGLLVILFGISFSVIDNFIISMDGVAGLEYIEEYNTRLRPMVFEGASRTGDFLRVGGYTGSYHDSANILGMLGSYYYIQSLVGRRWLLLAALISFGAMTLTQSAANIVLALFTCLLFTIYIIIKNRTFGVGVFLLAVALTVFFGVSAFPEFLVFSDRIGGDGDWKGMGNMLNIDMIFTLSFWFGFGYTLDSKYIVTEIGFLKGILEMGIVSACLLYWLLIYPAFIFVKMNSKSLRSLPYLAAIIFGFLSLAHYGSLFRVTNIGIFYAMYSLFFMSIMTDRVCKAESIEKS